MQKLLLFITMMKTLLFILGQLFELYHLPVYSSTTQSSTGSRICHLYRHYMKFGLTEGDSSIEYFFLVIKSQYITT